MSCHKRAWWHHASVCVHLADSRLYAHDNNQDVLDMQCTQLLDLVVFFSSL
jgi:hypothetical protein